MKPQLSEFSYGYAVTEALVRRFRPGLEAAPLFPSLFQEGQVGGGYDVLLKRRGVQIFLQFKLSDCMVRYSAREARDGLLMPPFYRMHLRPKRLSNQHQLLLSLETRGEEVYYVAPLFHRAREFNDSYLSNRILQRSIFLRPSAIGRLPDGDDHHVAFRDRGAGFFLSEPRRVDSALDEENLARHVAESVRVRGARSLTVEGWHELSEKILTVVETEMAEDEAYLTEERGADVRAFRAQAQRLHPVEQVAYLARTFLESECLVVWERGGGSL